MRIYTGLDLSRKRLDWHACTVDGSPVEVGAVPPDPDGLARLVHRLGDAEVLAVVEVMNGARFVHDQLELAGWDVASPTQRGRGRSLRLRARPIGSTPTCWPSSPAATWSRRCGCPTRACVQSANGPASACTWSTPDDVEGRIHQSLIAHGHARPTANLFGTRGRALLIGWSCPRPGGRAPRPRVIHLDEEIDRSVSCAGSAPTMPTCRCSRRSRDRLGARLHDRLRDRRHPPLPESTKLVGYTGLCPRVYQSGETDRRGALAKNGPNYLRWALIEAAHTAARQPVYSEIAASHRDRHGRPRGTAIAAITIARKITEAVWWMLTRNQPFAPASAKAV